MTRWILAPKGFAPGLWTCLMVAGLLALPACTTLGPDFTPPDATWAPAHFPIPAKTVSEVAEEAPDPAWWRSFNDPMLTALEARLAAGNLDIAIAAVRLSEARAALGVAQGAGQPTLNANASAVREQESRMGPNHLVNLSRLDDPYDQFQAGFDASWEVDLWGRVRRSVEQARAQTAQAGEALHGVQVTAAAELARDYVQLRGVQAKLGITRSNLESASASLALTRSRAAGGLSNDLDVANAATLVATIEATIPDLERQRDAAMNAIALLLGALPRSLADELGPMSGVPPVPGRVPVGVPADLVRRRADLREAEAALHAATAGVGVAMADFYPRLTLGGTASLEALRISNLADWAAKTYAIGPTLSLPLFDGGVRRATLTLREAQQQEAGLVWRARFLGALHDVDTALSAVAAEQRRRERLGVAALSARRALAIARDRYALGVADFLQVLTAQRAQLSSEQDLADSTANVATGLVQLYKALGGGWTEEPAPEAKG